MTKDEALDKLEEYVGKAGIGQFNSIEDAFNVAAMALNYIMYTIEEESKDD